MKALVTGAAGLIGRHLVQALSMRGYQVRAMVRDAKRLAALPDTGAEIVVADVLRNDNALRAACAGCDVVFHTAAYFAYSGRSAEQLFATAVDGSENILRSCADVGATRVVLTSSSVVFGFSKTPVAIDESAGLADAADDYAPYVAAKIAQDRRALDIAAELSLEVVFACPTMTLGPFSGTIGPSNAIIAAYLADPLRCTFAGGCNIVSARDVAVGHVILAERGVPGEHYLLGSENLEWQEVHAMIGELTGVPAPRIQINHTLAYAAAALEEFRAHMTGRSPLSSREQARMIGRWYWYDHRRAGALGYAPASARQALLQTISWLVASPHIGRELRTGLRLAPDIYRYRNEIAAHGESAG